MRPTGGELALGRRSHRTGAPGEAALSRAWPAVPISPTPVPERRWSDREQFAAGGKSSLPGAWWPCIRAVTATLHRDGAHWFTPTQARMRHLATPICNLFLEHFSSRHADKLGTN